MLHEYKETRYSSLTIAKSVVGRRNPLYLKATIHAPSVFFYVVAFVHPFKGQRLSFICCTSQTMVAQAGQLLSWPVSFRAGIPTPVWATTNHERRNSGGSKFCYITEIIIMMATPNQSHPQFIWLFLAVCRSDMADQPRRKTVTAPDERTARRMLAAQFILFFAGRLPVREVYHG